MRVSAISADPLADIRDPASIAMSIRVTLHGLVMLELAGALDAATAEDAFGPTNRAELRGWSVPEP